MGAWDGRNKNKSVEAAVDLRASLYRIRYVGLQRNDLSKDV